MGKNMGSLNTHSDYLVHFSNINSPEKKEEQIESQANDPLLGILTIEKVTFHGSLSQVPLVSFTYTCNIPKSDVEMK